MRVPDLDWPPDLFEDVTPPAPQQAARSGGPKTVSDPKVPLWPAMQWLWMRGLLRSGPLEFQA